MWHLKEKGLWRYQHISAGSDANRAAQYLKELQHVKASEPSLFDALAYDAIYVDEGQDFCEEDFCLLMELCRTTNGGEPNLYVFYDDAQNLLGRKRPNWQSLGLNVRGGRACIMTECFRNTRQIVEPAFNVLYGSFATSGGKVPPKEYGDIATLQEKGLIEQKDGMWHVQFTKRDGLVPTLSLATGKAHEAELLIARLRYLIEDQHVRPEDIQVLSFYKRRIRQLAEAIQKANLPFLPGVHLAFEEQDYLLGRKGLLSLSTVGSAKGYDAYCVLLASANEFDPDITGRVTFYVGCTRAIEYLEVYAAVAGLATWLWPHVCLVTVVPRMVFLVAGIVLLVIGVPMLVVAGRAATVAYNSDKLATTGIFGLTRNPIYSAWIVFNIPGLVLLSRSWPLFLTPIVAYLIFKVRIGRENEYLERHFGDDYRAYKAQVNEFIPFPKLK